MAHLIQAVANWTPLFSITPAIWGAIDQNTYVSINGDNGGTWAPAAPIVIGGAGMWFAGVVQWAAGSTVTTNGTTSRVTFGDSDYFTFPINHPGQSRTVATACAGSRGTFGWTVNTFGFAQSVVAGCSGFVELNVVDRATLTSAFLSYVIQATHVGGMPASVLRARIVRVDMLGNVTPITSGDANGFCTPTATLPVNYYNGGATQYLPLPMANTMVIDKSRFRYVCQIIDESGTNSLTMNQYQDVQCFFGNVPDTRPQ